MRNWSTVQLMRQIMVSDAIREEGNEQLGSMSMEERIKLLTSLFRAEGNQEVCGEENGGPNRESVRATKHRRQWELSLFSNSQTYVPRRKQTRPNEKAMFYMEYTSTSYPVTLECKLVAACKAIKRTQ
ncbi:hypothetical protein UY3_15735 [Chelonia mydas]|uniref:Uncharacterized protein n=1 Tax=Chelonia mydas TaxID=8469 RepID=M7APE2_CHEMY|nr:hypothetical protein UY3_15735 [Chelonia mydas]